MTEETTYLRPVRSFVRRLGRMSPSQKAGVRQLMTHYGLSLKELDASIQKLRAAQKPIVLEIGFGMGEGLLAHAKLEPDNLFVGIEVHEPGVGRLLNQVKEQQVSNLMVFIEDAKDVLLQVVADNSLERLQLFFPDPWPKKKHHKRRIVQPEFVELIAAKLKPGGVFHVATDWQEYYEHITEVMTTSSLKLAPAQISQSLIENRPKTRFEARGQRLGHQINDCVYIKA